MNKNKLSMPLVLLGLGFLMVAPTILLGTLAQKKAATALSAGNPQKAGAYYRQAAQYLFWRSDLSEQAGLLAQDPQQAILWLEKANQLSPEGLFALGNAYAALGKFDVALPYWQNARARGYRSVALFQRLAQTYDNLDARHQEIEALRGWLSLAEDASAHYRLGLLLIIDAPEEALTQFNAASRLDEEYAPVVETLRTAINIARYAAAPAEGFVVIGRALGLTGEWRLAADAFGRATQTDVANALAWAWLGEARQQIGLDGRNALEQALRLGREDAIVRGLRAMYWLRQERPQQAVAEYLLAASFDAQNPVWRAALGDAYARAGNLPPALQAYQQAVVLAPENPDYWRLLAVFSTQYAYQMEETGLPAALQAVELAPDDPAALDTLGWAYLRTAETELAREVLLRALELAPNYAWAHLHLGLVYLQEGRNSLAYTHLTRAQSVAGESGASLQAREILEKYFPE